MIAVHEVTVGQFREFARAARFNNDEWEEPEKQGENHPVVNVNWNDANLFCKWLSNSEDRRYRLPTEAEWEYAYRAKSKDAYIFGDDPRALGAHAWFKENADDSTHPVGMKAKNAWGLYDMAGNVAEWCSDGYADYPAGHTVDPRGNPNARKYVYRGGAYDKGPAECRAGYRTSDPADDRDSSVGFRIVLEPQ
jgi:formylglycine-generating enzyme required for sulfatase activity